MDRCSVGGGQVPDEFAGLSEGALRSIWETRGQQDRSGPLME